LQDKFCDAHDLAEAWNNIVISESVKTFRCTLLDCNPNDINEQQTSDISNGEHQPVQNKDLAIDVKYRKIVSLYQILF
jgi:hypothetical protein